MKSTQQPATVTPAKTLFDFSHTEVADALAAYVEAKGQAVPVGKRQIWETHRRPGERQRWTLAVEHEEPTE